MPATDPITSRAWLLAALDEAGRRLTMAIEAGALDPQVSWDADGVTITAKRSGDGVTIETKAADGTVPIARLVIPAGWTETT
jgi:hypothetical protein